MIAVLAASLAFMVGIADPGAATIPGNDVAALGLAAERRTVEWQGQSSFSGTLRWTPGLRHFLVVSGGIAPRVVPTTPAERSGYCGFVVSILRQYQSVHDVIVWNEPNLSVFWGAGPAQYAELLATCSSIIRSAGARIWAPGMSPSTTAGVADFAHTIAARGRHLIDGWDQHDYNGELLGPKIAAVRAAFGWRVPLLVAESGNIGTATGSYMRKAYCAGAVAWLNFKLWDNNDWKNTGLRRKDGSRKPSYASFQGEAALIRQGRETCGSQSAPPPPSPQTKPKIRRAHRSGRYLCPQGFNGASLEPTRRNLLRGICVLP